MFVSLDQAIEMHAAALRRRVGRVAPRMAREKARRCALAGDEAGRAVWLKVGLTAEALLAAESGARPPESQAALS